MAVSEEPFDQCTTYARFGVPSGKRRRHAQSHLATDAVGNDLGPELIGQLAQAPARIEHPRLDRLRGAAHHLGDLGVGHVMEVTQLHDRPVLGRQLRHRRPQAVAHLGGPQTLLGARPAVRGLVGVVGLHRQVLPAQGLQALAVGNAEDPGRQLAAPVEAVGPLPDHQQRVVEHLLQQVRLAQHVHQETRQPGKRDGIGAATAPHSADAACARRHERTARRLPLHDEQPRPDRRQHHLRVLPLREDLQARRHRRLDRAHGRERRRPPGPGRADRDVPALRQRGVRPAPGAHRPGAQAWQPAGAGHAEVLRAHGLRGLHLLRRRRRGLQRPRAGRGRHSPDRTAPRRGRHAALPARPRPPFRRRRPRRESPHMSLSRRLVLASGAALAAPFVHAQDKPVLRFAWWGGASRHQSTLAALKVFEQRHGVRVKAEYMGFNGYLERPDDADRRPLRARRHADQLGVAGHVQQARQRLHRPEQRRQGTVAGPVHRRRPRLRPRAGQAQRAAHVLQRPGLPVEPDRLRPGRREAARDVGRALRHRSRLPSQAGRCPLPAGRRALRHDPAVAELHPAEARHALRRSRQAARGDEPRRGAGMGADVQGASSTTTSPRRCPCARASAVPRSPPSSSPTGSPDAGPATTPGTRSSACAASTLAPGEKLALGAFPTLPGAKDSGLFGRPTVIPRRRRRTTSSSSACPSPASRPTPTCAAASPVAKQLYGRDELDKVRRHAAQRRAQAPARHQRLRRPAAHARPGRRVHADPRQRRAGAPGIQPRQPEPRPGRAAGSDARPPTADQSAQAIAGTLNIILKDAPRIVQKDLRIGVAYANENPVVNGGFTYGNRTVGGLGFVLPINVFQWDNRTQTDGERLRDSGATRLSSSGADRSHGRGVNVSPRLNWKLGDDETLTLQTFFITNRFYNEGHNDTEILASTPSSVLPPSLRDETRNRGTFQAQRVNLQYNNRFDEDKRVELRAGAGSGGADFNFDFLGRDKAGTQTVSRTTSGENRNRNATLSGKYSQYAGEAHTLTGGGEIERRTRDETRRTVENGADLLPGIEGQPFDATITRTAFYGQDEWEINKQWSAYFGVRHEQIKTVSTGVGNEFNSTEQGHDAAAAPELQARPQGPATWMRASLTRSYKAADVQQLIARPSINTDYPAIGPNARENTQSAPDRIGNPDLKPEARHRPGRGLGELPARRRPGVGGRVPPSHHRPRAQLAGAGAERQLVDRAALGGQADQPEQGDHRRARAGGEGPRVGAVPQPVRADDGTEPAGLAQPGLVAHAGQAQSGLGLAGGGFRRSLGGLRLLHAPLGQDALVEQAALTLQRLPCELKAGAGVHQSQLHLSECRADQPQQRLARLDRVLGVHKHLGDDAVHRRTDQDVQLGRQGHPGGGRCAHSTGWRDQLLKADAQRLELRRWDDEISGRRSCHGQGCPGTEHERGPEPASRRRPQGVLPEGVGLSTADLIGDVREQRQGLTASLGGTP
ncbi:hypothetical protein OSTOST_04299 [Ostertagia ostertagi]